MTPLVSILITTKNGGTKSMGYGKGKWLREAFNSALRQDYPELELCICDDGSDDGVTQSIIEEYLDSNLGHRFKVVLHRDNEGIPFGFNSAYSISTGEWVFPLGDDDFLAPNYISEIMAHIERKKRIQGYELDLCGTWVGEITPDGQFWNEYAGKETEPKKIQIALALNRFECGVLGATRKVWDDTGGYPIDMPMASDLGFCLTAVESGFKVGCVPKVIYWYRSARAGNKSNASHHNVELHLQMIMQRQEIHARRMNPYFNESDSGLLTPTVRFRKREGTLQA